MTNTEMFYLGLVLASGLLFLLGVIKHDSRANGFGGLVIVGIFILAILKFGS